MKTTSGQHRDISRSRKIVALGRLATRASIRPQVPSLIWFDSLSAATVGTRDDGRRWVMTRQVRLSLDRWRGK
jgi:hypothetical protein